MNDFPQLGRQSELAFFSTHWNTESLTACVWKAVGSPTLPHRGRMIVICRQVGGTLPINSTTGYCTWTNHLGYTRTQSSLVTVIHCVHSNSLIWSFFHSTLDPEILPVHDCEGRSTALILLWGMRVNNQDSKSNIKHFLTLYYNITSRFYILCLFWFTI